MVKLYCPKCGWIIQDEEPEKYAGRTFDCPDCGTSLTVFYSASNNQYVLTEANTLMCTDCEAPIKIPVSNGVIECGACGKVIATFPEYPIR